MTTLSTTRRRRGIAAGVTTAVAACLVGVLGAGSASAAPGFAFSDRIGGQTRVETAIATSKTLYPTDGTASDVVLVNLSATVDGLSASYLAGLKNAPILYSDTDALPSSTADEIARLGAKTIWMVGGTSVLSASLQSDLAKDYTVHRYGGANRYDTAAQVAEAEFTASGVTPQRIYVASGTSLADAVTVGPIAWARNYPILLTKAGSVPAETSAAMRMIGASAQRTVVGGTAVVSASTAAALGATDRLGGATRQDTAVDVANDAVAHEDFTYGSAALVGGTDGNLVDALSASPLAGNTGTPILYVKGTDSVGSVTAAYLSQHSSELTDTGYIFGGTSAVTDTAAAEASAAAQ